MNHGLEEKLMSLKTRLDGRSTNNNRFFVKDEEGVTQVVIRLVDSGGVTLEIDTADNLHIEKPNGWSSSKVK